jgi:hypothetical protein
LITNNLIYFGQFVLSFSAVTNDGGYYIRSKRVRTFIFKIASSSGRTRAASVNDRSIRRILIG